MTRYGYNFVLLRDDENGKTKEEIIEHYNRFAGDHRQRQREAMDREFLDSIQDGKYTSVTRQYTGHSGIPAQARADGKLRDIVYVSRLIKWS